MPRHKRLGISISGINVWAMDSFQLINTSLGTDIIYSLSSTITAAKIVFFAD